MRRHFFSFIVLSFILVGCVVTPKQASQSQIEKLSLYLHALDRTVPHQESTQLSRDIFQKISTLTKEFELTSPPLWHNFLVNVGLRKKGLCFHWSDSLYLYLKQRGYRHYAFHLVGANVGKYFLEHNALVIVPKATKIEDGVVIDPWRGSGKLYFSKVKEDKKYTWSHRTDRGCK